MEDYALCEMCRSVTATAMKSPGGFEHYNDVSEIVLHSNKCRLCSLMFQALLENRTGREKLKSICLSNEGSSDATWMVRLWLGDLTEWKFEVEIDESEGPFPDLGLVIVVVSCFTGSFPENTWKSFDSDNENIMHGTIEVCDQMIIPTMNSPKRLAASSSSDLSFAIIIKWLDECTKFHDKCKIRSSAVSSSFLPTRLIDVGSPDGLQQPHLCVVKDDLHDIQHDLHYVALSYCWGDRNSFLTTSSNISELRKEIPLTSLPRTIRDAILITRKLHVQYLWVDALCILQGREDQTARTDWQLHSALMGDIYSNALVTLGAAAGMHADSGFFHERKLPRYCRIPLDINDKTDFIDLCSAENREHDEAHLANEKQPLYKRSWALQERALSRRFLAYQTGQMYFRCSDGTTLEDGTGVSQYSDVLSAYSTESWNSSTWQRFVEKYSLTKATFETDKLPALSGLAKAIQETSKDEYLAGLWKKTIHDGLIWKTPRPSLVRRPSQYRAPSWSWAALDGEVQWLSTLEADPDDDEAWKFEVQYVARVVECIISPSELDNPFGEVACGFISIHGILKSLDEPDLRECLHAEKQNRNLRKDPIAKFKIFPDTATSLTEQYTGNAFTSVTGLDLFMLPIRECSFGCIGLILRYNPTNRLSYRRVGLFSIPSWQRDGSSWWFHGSAEQTIRIE